MTAVDKVDEGRIDHQGFVPEIYVGLLSTSLWMMQVGPSISNLSDYVEDILALALFVGSVICGAGVILGTKWFLPHTRRAKSYAVQLIGIPILIASLGWLTYASSDPNQILLTALAGGLGLCIEIGLVRLFVDIVQEFAHDEV